MNESSAPPSPEKDARHRRGERGLVLEGVDGRYQAAWTAETCSRAAANLLNVSLNSS